MTVNSYLSNLASDLVLSSSEKVSISISISTLENRLELFFGKSIVEKFKFGSSTRNTILPRKADDNSDIDYMIVFNHENNQQPQTYLNQLKRFAEKYYKQSEIHQSFPTIQLELNHLTRLNTKNDSKIKPVIRLLKHWNICKADRYYESYDLEKKLISKLELANLFCVSYSDYILASFNVLKNEVAYGTLIYNKINKAIKDINEALEYESKYPLFVENQIKQVFPEV